MYTPVTVSSKLAGSIIHTGREAMLQLDAQATLEAMDWRMAHCPVAELMSSTQATEHWLLNVSEPGLGA
jgi:hypothetical protein